MKRVIAAICVSVVPTLVIGARYDTMDPAHLEAMAVKVQPGRF